MTRMVQCAKIGKELPGLAKPPYPGPLGEKIYTSISQEGWTLWQQHQTMLINEYRLSALDPKAREFLKQEMEKFLFGGGSELPPDFKPPV